MKSTKLEMRNVVKRTMYVLRFNKAYIGLVQDQIFPQTVFSNIHEAIGEYRPKRYIS